MLLIFVFVNVLGSNISAGLKKWVINFVVGIIHWLPCGAFSSV